MTSNVQERLEASPLGRSVITGVIIFVFITLLSSNLPDSELKGQVTRLVEPVRDAVGLDQVWSVFAPNPRSESIAVDARIRYNDGSLATWTMPRGDPFISGYHIYRWRKFIENLRRNENSSLWPAFAIWLARQYDTPSKHPIDVVLTRRSQKLFAPGNSVTKGPWESEVFFTLQVTQPMLEKV